MKIDWMLSLDTWRPSKTKKTEIETMRTFVENGMMRSANDPVGGDESQSTGKNLRSFA